MDRIADYALIGDCETAALIDRKGTIGWLCWPRFDSEPCCAQLLGDQANGGWDLAADDPQARISRRYLGGSMVLETTIETASGSVRLIDFMPVRGEASDVVRIVIGERGEVGLSSRLRLRFDHGRLRPHWNGAAPGRAYAVSGPHKVRLTADVELEGRGGGDPHAAFTVRAGERKAFVLTYFSPVGQEPRAVDPEVALKETLDFWNEWCSRCAYEGPWRDAVVRSLVVMKALTYRPSGAVVAAPTSSLPERPGGASNWDYRFCWLRDATFTLLAFLQAGYVDEARAWRDWLVRAASGAADLIQPVYGLMGEARLTEWTADWLAGFARSRPVRFGNAAFAQRQFDIYGEVIDALHQAHVHGLPSDPAAWRLSLEMVEHLERVWHGPDDGIWETRGQPRRFTYSQVMIWAAIDRVVTQGEAVGSGMRPDTLPGALHARWRDFRRTVAREIQARGFNPDANSFVQHFGSNDLDASLLLLPQVGFLPAKDPRFLGTLAAIENRLVRGAFVHRQAAQAGDDASSEEAAFLACSFWYADALDMVGRRREAEWVFERVLAVRNDVGLLSEEFDPGTGLLVGNFPQALSHLALVNTAFRLFQPGGQREAGHRLKRKETAP